jgi:NAD(P)-dependent dehydrogenase (short-subunit alcohol dehydrogenase family)
MITTEKKVVIVTAAGKGIGAGIARHLTESGYVVSLMSPSGSAEKLADELGGTGIIGSVTSAQDIQRFISHTLEKFGRIDALVNNTGHLPSGDLMTLQDEQWSTGFEMILLNTIRLLRLITPEFLKAGRGAIVNISAYGAVAPEQAFPISSSLRASLSAFTRLYAERYAAQNIRINSVLPGFVDSWDAPQEIIDRIPMGRVATVLEISQAVEFLLSEKSTYITGQNILVDGALVNTI